MFVTWLATVATPAIGVGMSTLTSRHLAEIQGREKVQVVAGIFQFVWRRQYRRVLIYCLVYLLLIVPLSRLYGQLAPAHLLFLAGVSVLPLLLYSTVSITLRSLHRFDLLAAIHLFGTVITLLLVLLLIESHDVRIDVLLLALAIANSLALAAALASIIRLLPMKQAIQPGPFLKDRLTRGLSNSLLLFTFDVIVWQRCELLLLARGHSTADLGFYALSALISTRVMNISPALLSTCILPLFFRYIPGQRYTNAASAFVKTSLYVAVIAVPLCVLSILLCPYFISYCFGEAYLPVVTPLRILLVSAAFGSVSTVSLTHLANADRRRAQVRLGMVTALLKIALAVPGIVLWGITGAALASAVAQIISAIGSIFICKRALFT